MHSTAKKGKNPMSSLPNHKANSARIYPTTILKFVDEDEFATFCEMLIENDIEFNFVGFKTILIQRNQYKALLACPKTKSKLSLLQTKKRVESLDKASLGLKGLKTPSRDEALTLLDELANMEISPTKA